MSAATASTLASRDPAVVGRVIASTTLRLVSTAHFGGGESAATDAQLLRDADGRPFIPGASLAGACRSFLRSRPQANPADLELLFGGLEPQRGGNGERDDWTQSALSVDDALTIGDKPASALRDRVRIDPRRGAADDRGKFDFEALDPGTSFAVRLGLTLRRCDEGRQDRLRTLFNALLDALEHGDIRIGAHTRRGLGEIETASWRVQALDFTRLADVVAWLRDTGPDQGASERWGNSGHGEALKSLGTPEYLYVSAELTLAGPVLVRSTPAGDQVNAPDAVQLRSGGLPVVPGSSLAGALRHRAVRICRTLSDDHTRGDALIDGMFGPGIHDGHQPTQHRAARLRVDEASLSGSRGQRQTRIAIDRFTGGTLATALLEEQPEWPVDSAEAVLTVRLRLAAPTDGADDRWDAERGLLLLLLKDLCTGDLSVGGGAAVGRGVLRGRRGRMERGGGTTARWDWEAGENGRLRIDGAVETLEAWVQSLRTYLRGEA